ncbi:hypothetical protein GA0061099_10505 [Bradyrhizobium yuanmingense]|uniref:Uncharacterized protein n=1 Tax=Bradyrhizobium yuanmingense TaxID=108015 RepID=A0A1C3XLG1_9BRAD|nr:hypothetical protein IQ15_07613 [Bradyrhizobium yuanmingense]SCB53141.1 hypothetical protein GA0061099_10505 [Bradyrhizobium yuanmingense]
MVQYSCNIPNSALTIVSHLQQFVGVGGLLYIDYMLPYEEKYKGRPNCPEASWWKTWAASLKDWIVLHNRVLQPTLDPAHIEYPVDHYHQWGHVLLRRQR